MKKCNNCKYQNIKLNNKPCSRCRDETGREDKLMEEPEHISNLQKFNTLMLNKMTMQQNDLVDKVLEKVIYILYDEDIRLYDPQKTIEQIKGILERDGI